MMENTRATLVAVGLILLVGCVACGPKGPPRITEAKDILGTWEGVDSEGYFMFYAKFREDGTVRYAVNASSLEDLGGLNISTWTEEFWFDDGLYHCRMIKADTRHRLSSSSPCRTAIGTYEVHRLEDGSLVFTLVEDECESRARWGQYRHDPVEE